MTNLKFGIELSNSNPSASVLVDKYKTEEDRTLTRKISKLNMHSINKKSSRISQKLLNTIVKDPAVKSISCMIILGRYARI